VRLPLPEAPERSLGTSAAPAIIARAREVKALALGPGLSRAPESAELARLVVAESPAPVVLDADGLNAFAGKADLFRKRRAPLILTPHLGELSRLTGFSPSALEDARLDMARRFAEEWNVVLVMKGAPTVIASPDGAATVNPTGNPGMATMGMGDVLTGVIAAFLAQGLSPYDAARAGAYVHGLAADFTHVRVGTLGLVAGDVIADLPRALDRLMRSETGVPLPQSRIAPAPDGIRGA
jgi:NAD(P)H-hydrate epimerase